MGSSDSPMPEIIQIIHETAHAAAQSQGDAPSKMPNCPTTSVSAWNRTLSEATRKTIFVINGGLHGKIRPLQYWALVLLSW